MMTAAPEVGAAFSALLLAARHGAMHDYPGPTSVVKLHHTDGAAVDLGLMGFAITY